MTILSVNVDHVATLREARGTEYPDPGEAAALAESAGAEGITVHLRGDRRHIQLRDVVRLRQQVRGKLNLEMAATEEMIGIATDMQPDQVTLVPERPEEVTTEGGLDLKANGDSVVDAAGRLAESGMVVSLFLDPEPGQLEILTHFSSFAIRGFEINTDTYTRARPEDALGELQKIRFAARLGSKNGLEVYAGHGLTTANVGPVADLPEVSELNIGHAIVSRAVLVGMEEAVREMLEAMRGA